MTRAVRAIFGHPMHGLFRRGGLNWHLNLDEGVDFAIWLLGSFESDLVRFYSRRISPGGVVLDVGANIGAHTLHFARAVGPHGRVLAFEATSYACKKLRANLESNPELNDRVEAHHALLVDGSQTTHEAHIASSWPLAGAQADDELLGGSLKSVDEARVATLDELVLESGLSHVDWLKIDVDGHEVEILRGASVTLSRHRPHLIIELAPYCFRNTRTTFAELIQLLAANRYSLVTIPHLSPLPLEPEKLESDYIPRNGSINAFAVPDPLQSASG